MRTLAAALLLAACADPAIEVTLELPADGAAFDTSCVTAVDVYTYGASYLTDTNDYRTTCVEISGAPTFGAVRDALEGKVQLAFPDSGLAGVELDARTGSCDSKNPFATSERIFAAGARYSGGDTLVLPIQPVASCAHTQLKVKAIDVLALGRTKDCAMAMLPDGGGSVSLGTISETLFDGPLYWSSFEAATLVGSAGTATGNPAVGPAACLAADIGTEAMWSVSCLHSGASVCGGPGELEVGVIPAADIFPSLDAALMDRYGGVVIGSVWATGTPKAPVQGATIELADGAHGEVVYVEPSGTRLVPIASGAATGASGMFVLYTDAVTQVTVRTGRGSRQLKLGADYRYPAVALIAM